MSTAVDLSPSATPLERSFPKPNGGTLGIAPWAPQAFEAEQYRVLSYIAEQLGKAGRPVLAITSPVSGDGKTLTSINLARTLAQASKSRILLVDADLRRGSIGEQFGFGRSTSLGLSGAIADPACRLDAVVRCRPGSNLSVLPTGTCPLVPYEALRSARMGELLAQARQSYDYVLLDTPPVVPVADLRVLSQWVDGLFLVVGAHSTPRAQLAEALSALDPEKVVGIVYNGDDQPISRRYRSYYGYGEPVRQPSVWDRWLRIGRRP